MICSGKMRTSSVAEDMTRYFFIILLGVTTKVEIIFYRHNRDVVKLYETFDFNDKTSRHHKLFTNQHRPLILFYGRRAMFTVFNPRVGYVEEKLYLCGRITQNKKKSMNEISKCPKCSGEYVYFDGSIYVCPDCGYEFDGENNSTAANDETPRDSNGAELLDGDSVTVIKDLKVRGSSMVIKRGTKVKSIRLTENPEEVDCKIDGSSIVLKTCFLKK